ncbi:MULTISPECIES: hypothetical protein [Metabacillus]|uniref:hypothetical protein n=1 Tax=Metabacillus TaxID=2675233 RepID=UPI000C809EF3|nr:MULTISPECIES: hypothetical protein [Metabacillus]MBU7593223.1 hypothetical protein [Metabacillus halosaccharovorans]PMC39272.1 hypothetical protein CJ195_04895 [Bacillus sp. UMB0899]
MDSKAYQVCATCIHFKAIRKDKKMIYYCSRLKYETKPTYSFNCWNPKEHVKRLMEKRGGTT